jgi:hypothetical protein
MFVIKTQDFKNYCDLFFVGYNDDGAVWSRDEKDLNLFTFKDEVDAQTQASLLADSEDLDVWVEELNQ